MDIRFEEIMMSAIFLGITAVCLAGIAVSVRIDLTSNGILLFSVLWLAVFFGLYNYAYLPLEHAQRDIMEDVGSMFLAFTGISGLAYLVMFCRKIMQKELKWRKEISQKVKRRERLAWISALVISILAVLLVFLFDLI